MQSRVSFGPTEELMASAMGDEEGRKWPQMRRWNPNSTEGAPNGKSGLNHGDRFIRGGVSIDLTTTV